MFGPDQMPAFGTGSGIRHGPRRARAFGLHRLPRPWGGGEGRWSIFPDLIEIAIIIKLNRGKID